MFSSHDLVYSIHLSSSTCLNPKSTSVTDILTILILYPSGNMEFDLLLTHWMCCLCCCMYMYLVSQPVLHRNRSSEMFTRPMQYMYASYLHFSRSGMMLYMSVEQYYHDFTMLGFCRQAFQSLAKN